MNRILSVATVLAMSFLAVAIWLRQTLAVREGLDGLIAFQILIGFAILACVALLIRTHYVRSRKVSRPKRFEAVQHLRRLLSAVWS